MHYYKLYTPILLSIILFVGCSTPMYLTADDFRGLEVGMTESQVIDHLGTRPIRINRSRYEHGNRTQFVYETYTRASFYLTAGADPAYVFFENGRLVSVSYSN